jgi:hypothetical protein
MRENQSRRGFLKSTMAAGAALAAGRAAMGAETVAAAAGKRAGFKPKLVVPTVKIGPVEISRIILGANPFYGNSHGGPQGAGMREWYTDDRVKAVMDEAAEWGITSVWSMPYPRWIKLWKEYKDNGGKLPGWIGQPDAGGEDGMKKHIQACIDNGASAVCIQGIQCDNMMRHKRYDGLKAWLGQIKDAGLPAGMASHHPFTHLQAEEEKLPTDFYHQCLGVPENYTGKFREEPLETMRKIAKPMMGYKVLGAGRLKPSEAIPHVIKNIKPIDGIVVGVYPNKNPNEIRENVEICIAATKEAKEAAAKKG